MLLSNTYSGSQSYTNSKISYIYNPREYFHIKLSFFSSRLKYKQNFYLLSNMWKKLQWRIRAHNLTINMFNLDKHQIIKSIFTNKIISYYIIFFVLYERRKKNKKKYFFFSQSVNFRETSSVTYNNIKERNSYWGSFSMSLYENKYLMTNSKGFFFCRNQGCSLNSWVKNYSSRNFISMKIVWHNWWIVPKYKANRWRWDEKNYFCHSPLEYWLTHMCEKNF